MSSPPKEKVETKGGHLPAGKAPWAAAVLLSELPTKLQAFVPALFETRSHMMITLKREMQRLTVLDAPCALRYSRLFSLHFAVSYFLIGARSGTTSKSGGTIAMIVFYRDSRDS